MHDKLEAHDEHGAGSDCPVALHNCEPAPETQCVLTGIFKRHRVVEKYREAACTALLRSVHCETEGFRLFVCSTATGTSLGLQGQEYTGEEQGSTIGEA